MNDYNPGNVVVRQIDGVWRVSGVFDLMEYYFGDGEADLVRLMSIYGDRRDRPLAELFARTYLTRRRPRPGFAERFAIYMLRDRLIVWEYGTRPEQGWFAAGQSLRQYAGPYLELARTLGSGF
jgi:aminoglycoside phosphotransferase (APT) family kinase protein